MAIVKSMSKFSRRYRRHRLVRHRSHKSWVVHLEFDWNRSVGTGHMRSIHTLRKVGYTTLFHVIQHRLLVRVQHLLGSDVHGWFPAWNHAKATIKTINKRVAFLHKWASWLILVFFQSHITKLPTYRYFTTRSITSAIYYGEWYLRAMAQSYSHRFGIQQRLSARLSKTTQTASGWLVVFLNLIKKRVKSTHSYPLLFGSGINRMRKSHFLYFFAFIFPSRTRLCIYVCLMCVENDPLLYENLICMKWTASYSLSR